MTLPEEDITNDYPSNNNITNELIQKYDQKFNDLYRNIVNINSSIMNKEELIYKENDEIQYKNNTIQILQYTIVLVILFGILLMMYSQKNITLTKLFIFSILLFIIYLAVIYITMYSSLSLSNTGKYINNLEVNMAQFYEKNIEPTSGYQCPATCPPITPPPAPSTNQIQTYQQPTLNIDPQTNVWQYGDIPTDLYTSPSIPPNAFYANPTNIPNYGPSAENEPQPFLVQHILQQHIINVNGWVEVIVMDYLILKQIHIQPYLVLLDKIFKKLVDIYVIKNQIKME